MPLVSCPDCGHQVADIAPACPNCGRPHPGQPGFAGAAGPRPPAGPPVPNYLVQSILVTLCCCLPFGIVSIVYAAQVNSKLAAGDHAGAVAASQSAKTWCWVSFGVGLVFSVLYVALMMLGALGEMATQGALQ